MPKSHRRRSPIDRSFQVDGVLSLEPRQLLTVYSIVETLDSLGLNDLVRSIAPAEAGVENFGYDVVPMDDVNADGRPDFAVSAPGRRPDPIGRWGGQDMDEGPSGWVYIYSGADLSLLHSLTNNAPGFGASMAAVGDMDGDGVTDLVVGAPNDPLVDTVAEHRGRVTLYSGATGGIINHVAGAGIFFELGYSLQNIGDFDGDGHDDVIVGAPGAGPNPGVLGPGCAFVYSLIDATLLLTFTGEVDGDRFGHAVAGGFDIPLLVDSGAGDGVKDFVVGAPGYDGPSGLDSGRAYVFDGQTSAPFFRSPLGDGDPPGSDGIVAGDFVPEAGDRFGSSVGVIGAREDGASDYFLLRILVGAPGSDVSSGGLEPVADAGKVHAYSASAEFGVLIDTNVNVSLTSDPAANDRFGERILRLVDFVMADDIPELAVIAPGNTRGDRLTVIAGNVTNLFATGLSGAGTYSSAAIVGDLDGDGINDLIFGEAEADDAAGVPVRVKIVPFPIAAGSVGIGTASDDGNYLVLGSSLGSLDGGPAEGYVFHDGALFTFREMGLEGLSILGVNNAGLFFAEETVPAGHATLTQQYFVYRGVRTSLNDAIRATIGPAPSASLVFQSIGNTGDTVFFAANSAYLYRANQLIYLWEGRAAHVNDSGVVAGIAPQDDEGVPSAGIPGSGPIRMYTAAGQVVDIPGVRSTGFGRIIDNLGRIYGHNSDGTLLVWDNGTITELVRFTDLLLNGTFVSWTVTDVDDAGRVSATVYYREEAGGGRPPTGLPSANYLYEPGAGMRGTGLAIIDPLALPPPSGSGHLINRFITGNALLVNGRLAVPQPVSGAVDTAPDHPINVTWTARGLDVAVSSTGGQAIVLRLTGLQAGQWIGAPLPLASAGIVPPPIVPEVNLYTDPRDGRAYAIVRFDSQIVWFSQTFEGVYDEGRVIATPAPIASNLAIFTSTDQRVHVVGLTAGGDMIMAFQLNTPDRLPTDLENWVSVNLTDDHLAPQGQQTPRFTSDLTVYVAPWNGLNIAGIDDTGMVHTVWWAPGLTLWQTSNLSEIAQAPALTGNVTSYVTPWSGLNVAGTTADGKVATLWWVPQFGGEWRFDVLVPETPRGLAPGSLSAYVTSWGGLNIAGIDPETDKVAVYWWTPTSPWVFQNLPITGGSPSIEGRVTAIATPPGQLDIFARGQGDELLRFSWNPGDGAAWTVEDVGARSL